MKVLHICLACFYIDNSSYQENLLPKYHKKLEYDVEIIASLVSFDKNGKGCLMEKGISYINEHEIPVTRLEYSDGKLNVKLRRYKNTYDSIEKAKPDIIFVHGCQFFDIRYVVKYKKNNPDVKIFVDNHADFSNSARNWLSKNILHKLIWRHCAKSVEPYTEKFWGVLPARVDFLKNVYKINPGKIGYLPIGVDDEVVEQCKQTVLNMRKKYEIEDSNFLIVTGGKIDQNKFQILMLMEAINKINNPKIKLIVFGSVIPEYSKEFNALLSDDVKYIGWLDAEESYKCLNEADLVVFPGLHSVMWEQAVGLGKPCVFKYIKGFQHIDLGGNCAYFYEDNSNNMKDVLEEIINDKKKYEKMKEVAESKGKGVFSYRNIAEKSLDYQKRGRKK